MQQMWVWFLGWEDPLWRKWQPTLVFLPGKSYGQTRQAGYSPRGRKRATKQRQQISAYTKTSPLVSQTSFLVYQKLTCPSSPSPNVAPKKHVPMPLAWSVWSLPPRNSIPKPWTVLTAACRPEHLSYLQHLILSSRKIASVLLISESPMVVGSCLT